MESKKHWWRPRISIPKKKPIRNRWISPRTLELIAKRNRARTTKSKKKISREIKRQVRIDKNRFYESTADDIVTAGEHVNSRKVYNALRKLTGTKYPSIDTVKDENGKLIADANEKTKQWAKHFENLLNRPTANPASLTSAVNPLHKLIPIHLVPKNSC